MTVSKIGECVWCEGAPFTYKNSVEEKEGRTKPGWHIVNGIAVTCGESGPIPFNIDSLLETRDGTIIGVSSPHYLSGRNGAVEVDFFIKQGGRKIPDSDKGLMVYYDKNLKHIAGNHREADSDLDIVKIFEGKLNDRCPHCGEILD